MTTIKSQSAWVLALALGGAVSANAATVTLFDNLSLFGEGNTPLQPDGWIAQRFSTGLDCPNGCNLEKVTLRLNTDDFIGLFDTTGFKVEITSDGGTVPGPTVIGQPLMNPPEILGGGVDAMFTPVVETLLSDDTNYWVKLSALLPPDSFSELSWEFVFSGSAHWAAFDGFSLATGESGPFLMGVEVTPVPIPAAFWMMGTALVGLAVRAKRKA